MSTARISAGRWVVRQADRAAAAGVGQVGGAQSPGGLGDRVDPAGLGLEAVHGLFDQVVRDREYQVVFAGEVPVHGGRVDAERAA